MLKLAAVEKGLHLGVVADAAPFGVAVRDRHIIGKLCHHIIKQSMRQQVKNRTDRTTRWKLGSIGYWQSESPRGRGSDEDEEGEAGMPAGLRSPLPPPMDFWQRSRDLGVSAGLGVENNEMAGPE